MRWLVQVMLSLGAGIVVVRKFLDGWKVLSLESLDDMLDIPKGVIDPGESTLETALRETSEEAGITELDFTWGFRHISIKRLTCYVAQTSQDPVIAPNPHTQITEHKSAEWVRWETLRGGSYPFLVPVIDWAQKVVEKNSIT